MTAKSIFKKLNSRDTRLFPRVNTLTKIIFLVLITFTITYFVKNSLAATNIIKQTQDAQEKRNNSESWLGNSWATNIVNLSNTFTGKVPFKTDGNIDLEKLKIQGLLGTANTMVFSLYKPQASGVEYIAQVKDNFLGKTTYAQGVASETSNNGTLQPLLPLWKVLRNVIYSLSSLVFIAIGIMIMLRVKISPQAVITVQNAIPKIITSLILVTFSYAIAGLVIDISLWLQSFVIALFFAAKGVNNLDKSLFSAGWTSLFAGDANTNDRAADILYNFQGLTHMTFTNFSSLANATVPGGSMIMLGGAIGQVILGSIIGGLFSMILGSGGGFVGNWAGGAVGWVLGDLGGMIFGVILFIFIAIWLIKLFFGLLKTYVGIIIQIVTAPIMIGMGAFPNSKIGFSSWFIDLISKVAVFPVVLIFMVFINYLIDMFASGGVNKMWVPDLLWTGAAGGGDIIRAAIGLSGLAMVSKLPDLVPEALFQIKQSPFGKAIGDGLGSVGNMSQKYGKKAYEAGKNKYLSTHEDASVDNWFTRFYKRKKTYG